MDTEGHIEHLVKQARELPDGQQKVALLLRAVEAADALGDLGTQLATRHYYAEATDDIGRPDQSLIAIVWCLGKLDEHPEEVPFELLMFDYVHMAVRLVDLASVSRARIDEVFEDVLRRLREAGVGLRAGYHVQWRGLMRMGRYGEAAAVHKRWLKEPATEICYDKACCLDSECELLHRLGQDEEALDKAAPILDGRLMSPPSVPKNTLGYMLLSAMRLEREELIDAFAVRLRRWVKKDPGSVFTESFLILADARRGEWDRGVRVVERSLTITVNGTNADNIWYFCTATEFLLRRMEADGVAGKLRLPEQVEGLPETGERDAARLIDWLETKTREIGEAFDRRNGNESYRILRGQFAAASGLEPLRAG